MVGTHGRGVAELKYGVDMSKKLMAGGGRTGRDINCISDCIILMKVIMNVS
jgi:hypothetical protein